MAVTIRKMKTRLTSRLRVPPNPAAIFETTGNADCHIILRGGSRGPNYSPADIEAACAALRKAGVTERVMVDCSHANSAKKYERQIEVARLDERIGGELAIEDVVLEGAYVSGSEEDLFAEGENLRDITGVNPPLQSFLAEQVEDRALVAVQLAF